MEGERDFVSDTLLMYLTEGYLYKYLQEAIRDNKHSIVASINRELLRREQEESKELKCKKEGMEEERHIEEDALKYFDKYQLQEWLSKSIHNGLFDTARLITKELSRRNEEEQEERKELKCKKKVWKKKAR